MASMVNMNSLLSGKDSRWLQLEVCREFQRNKCSRPDTECKFAHPPANVEVQNGRVTACYDSIKVSRISFKLASLPVLVWPFFIGILYIAYSYIHPIICSYYPGLGVPYIKEIRYYSHMPTNWEMVQGDNKTPWTKKQGSLRKQFFRYWVETIYKFPGITLKLFHKGYNTICSI